MSPVKLTEAFVYDTHKYILYLSFAENGKVCFVIFIVKVYEKMREISDICRQTATFKAKL